MRRTTWILTLFAMVLIVLGGCANPASPGGTSTTTEKEVYSTTFVTPPIGWSNGYTSSDGYCTKNVVNGLYTMVNTGHQKFYWEFAPDSTGTTIYQTSTPYAIQSDMQVDVSGTSSGNGTSGFAFNYLDSSNYYIFDMNGNGSYRISKLSLGQWVSPTPVAWTSNAGNSAGQMNTVKLVQGASTLTVYVNGILKASYPIGLPAGNVSVGIITSSLDSTTNAVTITSSFKDFHIYLYQ